MTLAIGPFMGGGLWQSSGPNANNARRDCVQYPPWRWNLMDGAQLHAVYPYAGERASIVLFTHDAVLGSIPDTVHTQAALLGVSSKPLHAHADAQPLSRNYSTRLDWPLTSAVTEQAEATVNVGGYSFNDVHGAVQDNCHPSDESTSSSARTAAHVLSLRLLAMTLMACLAKRPCAARPQMPVAASMYPSRASASGRADFACCAISLDSLLEAQPPGPPILRHVSRHWSASPLSSSGRPMDATQCSPLQQFSEVVAINGCHSTFFIGTEAGCRTLSCDKYSSPYPSGDSGHYRCVGTHGADDGVGCYSTQHHFYLCDDGSKFSTCDGEWGHYALCNDSWDLDTGGSLPLQSAPMCLLSTSFQAPPFSTPLRCSSADAVENIPLHPAPRVLSRWARPAESQIARFPVGIYSVRLILTGSATLPLITFFGGGLLAMYVWKMATGAMPSTILLCVLPTLSTFASPAEAL